MTMLEFPDTNRSKINILIFKYILEVVYLVFRQTSVHEQDNDLCFWIFFFGPKIIFGDDFGPPYRFFGD